MAEPDLGDALVTMWERHDPAPNGLAERALAVLRAHGDPASIDAEYEVLMLVERTHAPAGVRGDLGIDTGGGARVEILSFAADELEVLVHVTILDARSRRIVGWCDPAQELTIQVIVGGRQLEVDADPYGRFEVANTAAGPTRLIVRRPGGRVLATNLVDL